MLLASVGTLWKSVTVDLFLSLMYKILFLHMPSSLPLSYQQHCILYPGDNGNSVQYFSFKMYQFCEKMNINIIKFLKN